MEFYPKRTVNEQAQRLPLEYRDGYRNSQIDRITMFDGTQELEITGYAEYSYLEEKSYKTQPVRTQDGAIQDIEEYATFFTPRLILKYNMMGIDDYRSVMKMLKRRNGYIIKCYDIVEDKIVKNEMYVAPPSMPKIYHQYLATLGIQEHAIELIGTNVPITAEDETQATQKISFYIASKIYYANFGMSWEEWVRYGWNTGGFKVQDGKIINSSWRYVRNPDGQPVNATDYVFAVRSYKLS